MIYKNILLPFLIKKFYKSFSYFVIFALFFSTESIAQKNGKLAGKISDVATNQPLSSASIVLKGKAKGTQSITDGTYILSLTAGTYSIIFSLTGYQTKEIADVVIKDGETNILDIFLDKASQSLTGVVIKTTKKAESQSAVYNKQKISTAASDGISFEAIKKTPDNNVGQIAKRITGVNVQDNKFVVVRGLADQYNVTMVNGVQMSSTENDRNAFALDLIPAAVVDNVVVNKTATPDMPGNFAGGVVQINTKDFPANDFYSIQIGTGFADATIGKDFYSDKRGQFEYFGFGYKNRALPKEYPSKFAGNNILTYNEIEKNRYLRMLNNNLDPINYGSSKPNQNFQFGYGKTLHFKNKEQFGIVLALSQRKSELIESGTSYKDANRDILPGGTLGPIGSSIGLQLNLNSLSDERVPYFSSNVRYVSNADIGGALNFAYSFGNNKITLKNLYSQVFQNAYIERPYVVASGSFWSNGLSNGYGVSYYTEQKRIANTVVSGEHRTGKDNQTRIDWNINYTNLSTKIPDQRVFVGELRDSVTKTIETNNGISDPLSALQQGSRLWTSSNDNTVGASFNITTPFILKSKTQIFKTGINFQTRKKEEQSESVGYSPRVTTIKDFFAPANFVTGSNLSNWGDGSNRNFSAGTSLLAIYESIENRLGKKMRIIWGLRAEEYQQVIDVFSTTFFPNFRNTDQIPASFGSRTSFDFLPSLNIVEAVTKKINFRAAVSKTVIRPELKDLSSIQNINFKYFLVYIGNPALKSSTVDNYDLKFEIFPSAGEIISVGGFYKNIANAIEYFRSSDGGAATNFLSPQNNPHSTVKGVEAEIRKKLDFIKAIPWLGNITLFGNGTLVNASVDASPNIAAHKLTGQSPYIVNAGLSVAAFKKTFEATISYNTTGDYIYLLGNPEGIPGRFTEKGGIVKEKADMKFLHRNLLDVVLTQSLLKDKLKIKLSGSNLLKADFVLYQEIDGNNKYNDPVKIGGYPTGPIYLGGTENAASSIIGQRTYTFSITYTF